MEKERYTLEENLAQHSTGAPLGDENKECLLLVSSLETKELKALNQKAMSYFQGRPNDSPNKSFSSFRELVHPDDYQDFVDFVDSCQDLDAFEERIFKLRLKSPYGHWKSFVLKNRLYQEYNSSEKFLLSIAKAANSDKSGYSKSFTLPFVTEQTVQNKENKYKLVLNALDQGFIIGEPIFNRRQEPFDFLITEVNPAFVDHTRVLNPVGRTTREFSGKREPYWLEMMAEVTFSGEAQAFEKYSQVQQKWFGGYVFPINTSKNKRVAVLFSDVTEKKVAAEKLTQVNQTLEQQVKARTAELSENNDLLQMVFDSVSQGIFLLKPVFESDDQISDFEYIRVNRKISRYYKQELVGKSFLELNPIAESTGVFAILKQTMLSGESKDFEINLQKEGRDNWFKISTRRQKGLLVNSLENITRRKKRAQELKENIRFKKQLIEATPDLIMIFDLYSERIRFLNRDFSEDPQMKQENITGQPLEKILPLIHPQDRQKAMEFHQTILKASEKDVAELEFRLRISGKSWEYFNARGKVFRRNKNGKVYEYIVILKNVHEQKQIQRALFKAEKLSIKGEIARTLAHELRSPLASIGMAADILEKKIDATALEPLVNYLRIIKRSTYTLNGLVTELLSSSNYATPVLEKACLAKIADSALSSAKDRFYLTGIKVVRKYKSPCFINADEEKLKIALLNLMVNACEAMVQEEGVLTLSIVRENQEYQLTIQDNGCGIEKDELDRLFESFYTRKAKGMGIGLSSVKNILEDHGATIQVKSIPREGTTFILVFPCYEQ